MERHERVRASQMKDGRYTCSVNENMLSLSKARRRGRSGGTTRTDSRGGFEQLMEATKYCSLGQLTAAMFEVGGQYRRNM